MTFWHGLRPTPIVLKFDAALYRRARLLCQYLEELSPEVSQRAGFAYDLGLLRNLPDDARAGGDRYGG